MSIRVRCAACENTFQAPRKYEGRRARCPKCSQPVYIVEHQEDRYPPGMAPPGHDQEHGNEIEQQRIEPQRAPGASKKVRRAQALPSSPLPATEEEGPNLESVFGVAPVIGAQPEAAAGVEAAPIAPVVSPSPNAADDVPDFSFAANSGEADGSLAARRAARNQRGPLPVIVAVAAVALAIVGLSGAAAFFLLRSGEDGDDDAGQVAENGDRDEGRPTPADANSADGAPSPAAVSQPAPVGRSSTSSDEVVARLTAQARRYTVKLRVDKPSGGTTGTGFFVSGDGWVATSHRLIEGASGVTVQLGGDETADVESAGIVRVDRAHDLALIAAKPGRSFNEAPLRKGAPLAPGAKQYAAALPAWGDQWLSECELVATHATHELPPAVAGRGPGRELLARDMVWMEFAGEISPDGVGGPLLDETGAVSGVCLFSEAERRRVYAASVGYLAALLREAQLSEVNLMPYAADIQSVASLDWVPREDDPMPEPAAPLPAAPPGLTPAAAAAKQIDSSREKCAAAEGYPINAQQYADFQQLALELTAAAQATQDAKLSDADRKAVEAAIVEALEVEIDWQAPDHAAAVNRLAAQAIDEGASRGLYAFGTVAYRPGQFTINGRPATGFELAGTNDVLLVPVRYGAEKLLPGTKWMIYGVYRGRVDELSGDPGTPDARRASLIDARFLVGEPDNAARQLMRGDR